MKVHAEYQKCPETTAEETFQTTITKRADTVTARTRQETNKTP